MLKFIGKTLYSLIGAYECTLGIYKVCTIIEQRSQLKEEENYEEISD